MSIDDVVFDERGLVPVILSNADTGDVLCLAWADRAALEETIVTRQTVLFSRSRNARWRKGETSGNTQRVREVVLDCDGDAVLYRVEPAGPACHTGAPSCFCSPLLATDRTEFGPFVRAIAHLDRVLESRRESAPADSYVGKLFAGGVDRIGKKIGEEATEVVIAAKNDDVDELVWESSDLLFHLLVLLRERGVPLERVGEHLLQRAKP